MTGGEGGGGVAQVAGTNSNNVDQSQNFNINAGGLSQLADDRTISALLRDHRLGFGYSG